MIDPNLPLELDDGTPVTLIAHNTHWVDVEVPKSPYRAGYEEDEDDWSDHVWSYEISNGVFGGGTARANYVLRNVPANAEPEDWS